MSDYFRTGKKEQYPTLRDYQKMGLTDYQISRLIEYENHKHGFKNSVIYSYHFNEPHSIFFLDIKGTLYHSGPHGSDGNELLGRAMDSYPIFIRDILALGSLLNRVSGERFTMDGYELSQNHKIAYRYPENRNSALYKLDLPTRVEDLKYYSGMPIKYDCSEIGPYTVVFISDDSIDTQRNIILFFLTIYSIFLHNGDELYIHHKKIEFINHQSIIKLEELFDKCHCNFDTFIEMLPYYIPDFEIKRIKSIVKNITFLSTIEMKMSKNQLMTGFLEQYNREYNLCTDDYNVFACGDNLSKDGEMIMNAFKLGGYGMLNAITFDNIYTDGETLRRLLYERYDITTPLPLVSYGFSDFYNRITDIMSLERTWELAMEMEQINNNPKGGKILTMDKTNHYLWALKK